jgi:hypothetical protein
MMLTNQPNKINVVEQAQISSCFGKLSYAREVQVYRGWPQRLVHIWVPETF